MDVLHFLNFKIIKFSDNNMGGLLHSSLSVSTDGVLNTQEQRLTVV